LISIVSLAKSYGARTLFEGVSMKLVPGSRYGLVGANGSGKTTLMQILAGDEPASDGTVTYAKNLRLGVLRQDQFAADDERIVEVAMRGDADVYQALREQENLSHTDAPDGDRLIALHDIITHGDGYTLESRARETLVGLGIDAEALDRPLGTLSGGFKLRVLLAQVLVGRPDALLLDEPTNHLDILSIRWLEQFLQGFRGCAVIISHDRRFLDATATRILDVDYEMIVEYQGNYESFIEQKQSTRDRKEAEIAKTEKIIAQKKAFIERFRAKATKARQAQSRLKQVERMEVEELAQSSRRYPRFSFQQVRQSGRDVLTVEALSKAYGEKSVLSGVGFSVRRGERVALIGANGIGKSTLLKIVTGNLEADAGSHAWGHEVRIGYFPQDHHEALGSPNQTALQVVWDRCPTETTGYVRGQLGRVLFSGSDVDKKVGTLSGGEAARLVFARLAVEKPNVLVLDEPTNHLDLEAIEALTGALLEYPGTLLFVSHDRHFVGALATHIIELRRDGLTDYAGTYAEYIARAGDDHLDTEAVVLKARKERREAKQDGRETGSKTKRTPRQKALPRRRDELLARIEQAEGEKAALAERYAEPGFFDAVTPEELTALRNREQELEGEIARYLAEWEAVEAELAELG
jgi:ATPase subunit of ABC transporter with duplicated ATPase domains